MKRKKLEMLLSGLKDMESPRPELEQYTTPSRLVCDILLEAYSRGDIEEKKVCELGCGPGPFVIGSWLLGASEIIGIDIDERAVSLAKDNLMNIRSGLKKIPRGEVEFIIHDLKDTIPISPHYDTTLMNPPFGSQKKYADRPFIKRAMEISPVCYSIHNGNSLDFLRKLSKAMDIEMELLWKDNISIPAKYDFHREEKKEIGVLVIRMTRIFG
jgi:putative methylase